MLLQKKLSRNLALLILLVALSSKSFSQTAIDSSKIVLTKPIAKLVVKDLVSFDQIRLELNATNNLLTETNSKLKTQSILITNLNSQISNYDNMFLDLNNKYSVQEKLSEDLNKALKRQRAMTTIYKIGTTVGVVATALLLIQN